MPDTKKIQKLDSNVYAEPDYQLISEQVNLFKGCYKVPDQKQSELLNYLLNEFNVEVDIKQASRDVLFATSSIIPLIGDDETDKADKERLYKCVETLHKISGLLLEIDRLKLVTD